MYPALSDFLQKNQPQTVLVVFLIPLHGLFEFSKIHAAGHRESITCKYLPNLFGRTLFG